MLITLYTVITDTKKCICHHTFFTSYIWYTYMFNDGVHSCTKVIKHLGIEPGHNIEISMTYWLQQIERVIVPKAMLNFQKRSQNNNKKCNKYNKYIEIIIVLECFNFIYFQ